MKNYDIKHSEHIQSDTDSIYYYILKDGKDIAIEQVRKIRKKIDTLENFPNIGKTLEGTDYKFLVSKPYLIFYKVFEQHVEVLRILDGRRDYMRILFQKLD